MTLRKIAYIEVMIGTSHRQQVEASEINPRPGFDYLNWIPANRVSRMRLPELFTSHLNIKLSSVNEILRANASFNIHDFKVTCKGATSEFLL